MMCVYSCLHGGWVVVYEVRLIPFYSNQMLSVVTVGFEEFNGISIKP